MPVIRIVARFARALAGATLAAALVAAPALAADPYPTRAVKVVVPYSVGGGTDVLTRALAQRLAESTGQSFVIENRAGADASIGAAMVAKAPPDGYTLLAVSGVPFLLNQSAYKDLPYHTTRDLMPIALFASLPMLMVAANATGIADAKTLVAQAKGKPKTIAYAGTDQMTYLGMEMITKGTGTEMNYVPYKGAGPALNDLLGNHVNVMLASPSSAMPHVKDGRIKALATTGSKRSPALPDVPTVAESILPGYELTAWFGLFAPAGTPKDIIERVAAEVQKALQQPALQKQFESLGTDVQFMGPAAFASFIDREMARWTKAYAESGLGSK